MCHMDSRATAQPLPLVHLSDTAVIGRQFIAQLMRIHVVTPKEPMICGILPKLKINRGIPIFTPGIEDTQVLEGGTYWILRLPLVFLVQHITAYSWLVVIQILLLRFHQRTRSILRSANCFPEAPETSLFWVLVRRIYPVL